MVVHDFDSALGLLVVEFTGVIKVSDFTEDYLDVPAGTRELIDTRRATETELTTADLRYLAERDTKRPTRISKVAIVADSDVGFGLARMYQSLSDGQETEVSVFRDEGEARAWLGL